MCKYRMKRVVTPAAQDVTDVCKMSETVTRGAVGVSLNSEPSRRIFNPLTKGGFVSRSCVDHKFFFGTHSATGNSVNGRRTGGGGGRAEVCC